MKIDVICSLPTFRQFMIISMCESFIPADLLSDEEVFPERVGQGTVYVEAEDKQTIRTIREVAFMYVSGVLGVIYNSKSGKTKLKWRSLRDDLGKLTGEVSNNSLVNLFTCGVLDLSYATQSRIP